MLSTDDVSTLLQAEGLNLSPTQVAELARNHVFPNAFKQDGRWVIHADDLANFIRLHKIKKRRQWITTGTIALFISILGLSSITKDTLDLVTQYIAPTATPSLPVCTVQALGENNCAYVKDTPNFFFNSLACLPPGAKVTVVDLVPGNPTSYYQIASYHYDKGPVTVTEVFSGSPAEKGGLHIGDVIIGVDDINVEDSYFDEWRGYIIQKAGESVILHVRRKEGQLDLPMVPRTLEESDNNPLGFRQNGGLYRGEGGYVSNVLVSCTEPIP